MSQHGAYRCAEMRYVSLQPLGSQQGEWRAPHKQLPPLEDIKLVHEQQQQSMAVGQLATLLETPSSKIELMSKREAALFDAIGCLTGRSCTRGLCSSSTPP